MKKLLICLVAIVAVLSFGLTNVHAYPYIEVEGFVNPGEGIIGATTTSFAEVEYTINVTFALMDAEMDSLSLEFENDVFESFGMVTSSVPNDWVYSLLPSVLSIYQLGGEGSTIPAGQSLTFTVTEVVVFNEALVPGNGDIWDEGQIWAQSLLLGDTEDGGDATSTTLVPEPGTVLLLGSGLAGLFYVRRKNVFNT